MSTKSFQTEFVFSQKGGKKLAVALKNDKVKKTVRISKPVKFINKNDRKSINSILDDFK
ncbi:hypothetical protein [Companilactobacillus hulinensis]|uniref:hypothetical protein n=1 Tax=Companilactobacillus hulinensis TaxID=2486007 RepID=UPI0013DDDED1|nr:hypothetical protein [Companilactobacillus hulinensis]